MKKVDIKSFLIGVLITTNLFFFMGFSSTKETDRDPLYDNDDIMRVLKSVQSDVSSIKSKLDSEFSVSGYSSTKKMIKEIWSEVY